MSTEEATISPRKEETPEQGSDIGTKVISLLIMGLVVAIAVYLRLQREEPKVEIPNNPIVLIPEQLFVGDNSEVRQNIDSLVVYQHKWVIATAKATNSLFIYDATNGSLLFTKLLKNDNFEVKRPNGLILRQFFDREFLLIAERDGKRVTIVDIAADFKIVYQFGDDILKRPYGLDIMKMKDETYHLFITDNYMLRGANGKQIVPPNEELDKRVLLFELVAAKNEKGAISFKSKFLKKIGDIVIDSGMLNIVETVVIDEAYDRLVIADEKLNDIKIYNLTTHEFSGKTIGIPKKGKPSTSQDKCSKKFSFIGEPEGFVIFSCQTKEPARKVNTGFYIFTDQLKDRSKFHIVRRDNLCYVGSFMGNEICKTDGVTIDETLGLFYAVHDDRTAGSFKLKDIVNKVIKKNLSPQTLSQICPL